MGKLLIAEIGSVHDGSFGNACKLIDLAYKCGVNVVKFQTHISDKETLKSAPSPSYFHSESRFNYFNRTAFTLDQWLSLKKHADELGISFLSSPFSIEAIDLLEKVGVEFYKIPSGEVNNYPLIEYLAGIGKPVILSSGMSAWAELDLAVEILLNKVDLTVMQCTSAYPCPPERVGLNIFGEMRARYGNEINLGFSDHTSGVAAGIAASALGVDVIEKHLTFSKSMYGSDALNALEPSEFKLYCDAIKEVWVMNQSIVDKNDLSMLTDMKKIFEKSIVASRNIPSGASLTIRDLGYKKPGNGIPAGSYKNLIGRKLRRDVLPDHQFSWEDLE